MPPASSLDHRGDPRARMTPYPLPGRGLQWSKAACAVPDHEEVADKLSQALRSAAIRPFTLLVLYRPLPQATVGATGMRAKPGKSLES